jgi:hypothetical protein
MSKRGCVHVYVTVVYACECVCTHTPVFICTHTHTHTYTHTHTHTHTYIYILHIVFVCIHIFTNILLFACVRAFIGPCIVYMHVYVYIYERVCMYAYVFLHLHINTYIHTHTYIHTYTVSRIMACRAVSSHGSTASIHPEQNLSGECGQIIICHQHAIIMNVQTHIHALSGAYMQNIERLTSN